MARFVDGRSALRRFDGVIAQARTALGDAIESTEELTRDLAEIRREQAGAYLELAGVKITETDTAPELRQLARLDEDVAGLIEAHDSYLEDLLAELDRAADAIAQLEASRDATAETLDEAIAAYEEKVHEVETALEADEAYRALVDGVAEAESVTERARAKLTLSRDDMDEKGEVFRSDPLFMYLWKRRYRTPDYKAGTLARFFDGWVARLCGYDKSYRNYERLVELPAWLEGHVAAMEAKEQAAETALADTETAALKAAGADALASVVDSERAKLDKIDADIAAAEIAHLDIAARQTAAERGEAGPAFEARERLAEALRRLAIPDLRVLATQTVTPRDDGLVDELVGLRKDEMSLEMRLDADKSLPKRRRSDLDRLEQFRRAFKSNRMDSAYASFNMSRVDDVVAKLVSGGIQPTDAVRYLSRGMRRRTPNTDPRFGGQRRAGTLGLPDIAVGIGLEILKEVGRSSSRGRSPWGGGGSFPRGRQTRFPKPSPPSRRRGSSRSGGGRRRGKFKTGGGF